MQQHLYRQYNFPRESAKKKPTFQASLKVDEGQVCNDEIPRQVMNVLENFNKIILTDCLIVATKKGSISHIELALSDQLPARTRYWMYQSELI